MKSVQWIYIGLIFHLFIGSIMLTNKKFFPNDEEEEDHLFDLDDEFNSFFFFEYFSRVGGQE